MARGVFITVEGGEGVGKSSLIAELASHLRALGLSVVTTREPGGTKSADRIRAVFASATDDPLLMSTEALLVCAARAQHVGRVVEPALAAGQWVLCDRYNDSTRIYQGILGGIPAARLEPIMALATGGLEPDLTLVLDCEVAVSQARLAGRASASSDVARYDLGSTEFHGRLRRAFLDLAAAHPERMVVLDAGRAPNLVAETAVRIVDGRFGLGGQTVKT